MASWALPSMQEVFYGHSEPTYIYNNELLRQPMRFPPPAYYPDPHYRTNALVAPVEKPKITTVSTVRHPEELILHVPMCCEKCVEKVRVALMGLPGTRDVVCDQYEHKVIIAGKVNAEEALRRVRRVKKRSKYWNMTIQPLIVSSRTTPKVETRAVVNPHRAPGFSNSAYRAPSSAYSRFVSPPRQYTSSYSRGYSSPYIDSAYRSGYGERGYGHFNSAYDRTRYVDY